jgi:NADH-quinone oxidoreductase subunit H
MHSFSLISTLVTILIVIAALQGACAYLIYVERKIAAFMQDRIGPNRVGPFGLLQPIADGLKFLFKEEVIPAQADRVLYLIAPTIALLTATIAFAVVPFGPTSTDPHGYPFLIAPNVDVGVVFIFAVSSLTVYSIILGGWASNNKYSLLGGLRSSAQMVSYEIPMGMSLLGVFILAGSLNLERIIERQVAEGWFVFYQPLAFLLFLVSVFAECNRLPFDLPEAEQELVGGYHTEYGALKFGLFFLGEYTHMITTSFLLAILFFGGWHFPGLPRDGLVGSLLGVAVLLAKVLFFILLYMVVRWTIPRFRYDQLMDLAWKVMIPLALVNLATIMVIEELQVARWSLFPAGIVTFVAAGGVALAWPRPRRRLELPSLGKD